jgi:glycolate oxidase
MKSVSGYDLTKIFVGSEGTLGVITEITLKINPKTTAATTALATFNNLGDAGNAVSQSMYSGIIPSVLEILGRETIKAINQNTELALPEVDAILLVETDGYTKTETDFQMQKIIEVFKKNNADQIKLAQTQEEAAELWAARKSAYAVLARLKPNLIIEDVTVPMSKIADLLKGIKEISNKHNIMIATYGHAGDGNLHPQFMFNGNDPDQVKRQEAADADIFKLAIDLGGTLTGEHGIGLQKAPYMTLEHDAAAMDVMRSIKKMLDPNNILNPGKMALEG